MPFTTVTLRPGVNVVETPALNQAGVSSCNLIRYYADPNLGALIAKTGGWERYFSNQISNVPRALWGWMDTESIAHLAVGTQNASGLYESQLSVITDGILRDITPRAVADNVTPTVAAVSGNSIVTITDATTPNVTVYDAVYIPVHISVGGLILFGLYQCDPDAFVGTTTYTVQAHDKLGRPLPAPSSSTSPTVAKFSTTNGSSVVNVELAAHGYVVGDTYPVLAITVVGGVSLYGNFIVQRVIDTSHFEINGLTQATSTTTGFINGGKARYVYSFGIGAIPSGTGFGVGGFGRGGFGTGSAVVPSLGYAISAVDWTLDNWAQVLIACPITTPVILTTTAATGNATTVTLTYSGSYKVPVGSLVTVSGVTPNGYNGTFNVTASTLTTVSYLSATTGAQTVAGTIEVGVSPFQPIYQWDSEAGPPTATIITAAPPVNDGIFIAMPQRQIVAWGSTFTGVPDPLLVRWSDVGNYNIWIGQAINQAGSYRLTRGSRIVGGMQGPTQGFIWTDLDVWSMQYIGQPGIYSFNIVGQNCGLIGRKAMGALGGIPFWMGPSQFYRLGEGIEVVPCPVWDAVFQNMDTSKPNLIRFAANSRFNEVAWYYPSLDGGGEVDSYVKFNVLLGAWDYGSLGRSAWIDQSVLGPPIGSDPASRYLYQHETSPDADGQAMDSRFRTGYWAMSETDMQMFIDSVRPDAKFGYYGQAMNATLMMTFFVTDYPGNTPVQHGPYSVTQATEFFTTRMRGNLIAMEVGSEDVGSWWRIGAIRYRAAPDGRF